MFDVTEVRLGKLLAFVRGEFYPYSPGMSVHRNRTDGLMGDMVELERRGLVRRKHEDDSRIDWGPVAEPTDGFQARENRRHRIATIVAGMIKESRDGMLYKDIVKEAVFIDDCICEATE
jgi:hypothetical protein